METLVFRLPPGLYEWGRTLLAWRHRLATLALFLLAVWLAFGVISGPNGWVAFRRKKTENLYLQQEVQQLQLENQELEQRVNALKNDPRAIEREAREQLRYAKPGEIVYVMPDNPPARQPQQPSNSVAQKK